MKSVENRWQSWFEPPSLEPIWLLWKPSTWFYIPGTQLPKYPHWSQRFEARLPAFFKALHDWSRKFSWKTTSTHQQKDIKMHAHVYEQLKNELINTLSDICARQTQHRGESYEENWYRILLSKRPPPPSKWLIFRNYENDEFLSYENPLVLIRRVFGKTFRLKENFTKISIFSAKFFE